MLLKPQRRRQINTQQAAGAQRGRLIYGGWSFMRVVITLATVTLAAFALRAVDSQQRWWGSRSVHASAAASTNQLAD